jgi:hypothetical protein
MSLMRLSKNSEVPPGGYRFTCPETGYKIEKECTLDGLLGRVASHYVANEIPLPDDWKEKVVDQLCHQLPPGWCVYEGTPTEGVTPDLSAERVLKGIKSLAAMFVTVLKGESPFVDQNTANERAKICSRCYYNMETPYCGGCGVGNEIRELVSNVKGGRTTPYDHHLKACGMCGCKNEAIVHVNRNLLLSGEKSETTTARPDWCWLKTDDLTQASESLKL